MIHGNGSSKKRIKVTRAHEGQEKELSWAHHSVDVSDASLAEFERLMASRGFRASESSSIVRTVDTLSDELTV